MLCSRKTKIYQITDIFLFYIKYLKTAGEGLHLARLFYVLSNHFFLASFKNITIDDFQFVIHIVRTFIAID